MPLASHPATHLACTELCCPGLPLTATTCCRCLCPQPFGSKPLATNVYVRSPSGRCPGSPASASTAPCTCRDIAYARRLGLPRRCPRYRCLCPSLMLMLRAATTCYRCLCPQSFGSMPGFSSQHPQAPCACTAPCACRDVAYAPPLMLAAYAYARRYYLLPMSMPAVLRVEARVLQPAPASALRLPRHRLCPPLMLMLRAAVPATNIYDRSPSGLSRLFPVARRSGDRNCFYAIFYAPPDFGTAFALTLKRNFFHLIWLVSIELPAVVRQPVFFFFPALAGR